MVSLEFLKFSILTYPKRIAVLFSGGSDSTLLLYLTLLDIEKSETNHVVSVYIIDRYNKPINHAIRIIDLLSKKMNKNISFNILKIPKVEQKFEVIVASKILESQHDVILWGINKYPSDETIRPNSLFNFIETSKIKLPFADIEKDKLISSFYELGIEDILYQTHSCGLNLDNPCTTCFNCRERAWAFRQLGKEVNLGI